MSTKIFTICVNGPVWRRLRLYTCLQTGVISYDRSSLGLTVAKSARSISPAAQKYKQMLCGVRTIRISPSVSIASLPFGDFVLLETSLVCTRAALHFLA